MSSVCHPHWSTEKENLKSELETASEIQMLVYYWSYQRGFQCFPESMTPISVTLYSYGREAMVAGWSFSAPGTGLRVREEGAVSGSSKVRT